MVCDESSFFSTYQHNHTLERLCIEYQENSLPEELSSLLQINRDNNSSQAARLKIFEAHFHESYEDLTSFTIRMKKNALPCAIAWMARDKDDDSEIYERSIDCVSVMFRISRTMLLERSCVSEYM
jgi:hypothetical protein